jgi:hypothetical protein
MTDKRMKSLLSPASALLAVFALLFASNFVGAARQTGAARQAAPQGDKQLPELASQEINPEAFRIKLPKACEKIQPDVQTHDVNDNFSPPGVSVTLSPALTAFSLAVGRPARGYDDKSIDKFFYDSFKLRGCRVCYATLELSVKHEPEPPPVEDTGTGHQTGKAASLTDFHNDNITVGGAPFGSPPLKVLSADIWPPLNTTSNSNPKPMFIALPTNALNAYVMSGSTPPGFLDVVVQDDTDVDYITLKVWYF